MKKMTKNLFFALFIVFPLAGSSQLKTLDINQTAPLVNHKMLDVVSNKSLSLNEVKGDKGLVVIFSCKNCGYVQAWKNRYPNIIEACKKNGLGIVFVNSNEARRAEDHVKSESPKAMKKDFQQENYTAPYVVDTNSTLANAFGAKVTPEVFIFNEDLKLVYHGAIDDNPLHSDKVKHSYVLDIVQALAKKQKVPYTKKAGRGCPIKRLTN